LVAINRLFSTKQGFLWQLTLRWQVESIRSVIRCGLPTILTIYLDSFYSLLIYQDHAKGMFWFTDF